MAYDLGWHIGISRKIRDAPSDDKSEERMGTMIDGTVNSARLLETEPAAPLRANAMEPSSRYHHLDAVRAFALLLGVFFHAAESFDTSPEYWAIADLSQSRLLGVLRFACHSFRMELFFVIAGFFARFMLARRGTGGFVKNRLQRVLVPLVVGWCVLYPLCVLIWLWGASVTGRLPNFGVPAEAVNLPVWKLALGFFLTGGFLQKFDLTHLWFLHQLLWIYVAFLALRWIVLKSDGAGRGMGRVDRWFAWINKTPGTLFWFVLPSVPMLLMMRYWGVDTPKESLLPYLPTTVLFSFFFLAGWLWQRQPELLEVPAQRWWWYVTIGLVAWWGLLEARKFHVGRPVYTLVYAHMMWGFVLGFLGLFTRVCRNASPWTRYVADSSFWIYLAHLPLVVVLQVIVGRLAWPWPLKYIAICATAFPLLFASYHYLVRPTFIGAKLNGRRYPRRWPWQADR